MNNQVETKLKKINDKHWSNPIVDYVLKESLTDEHLQKRILDETKSINDMCNFILKKASKIQIGGATAVSDEEVYNWAIHYFIEDKKNLDEEVGTEPARAVVRNSNETSTNTKKVKKEKVEEKQSDKLISIFDLGVDD